MRSPIWTLFAALLLGACTTIPAATTSAPGVVSAADARGRGAASSPRRQARPPPPPRVRDVLALTWNEKSGIGAEVPTHQRARARSNYEGREEARRPTQTGSQGRRAMRRATRGRGARASASRYIRMRRSRTASTASCVARAVQPATPWRATVSADSAARMSSTSAPTGARRRGRACFRADGERLPPARASQPAPAASARSAALCSDRSTSAPTPRRCVARPQFAAQPRAEPVGDLAALCEAARPVAAPIAATHRGRARLVGRDDGVPILKQLERSKLAALGPDSPQAGHLSRSRCASLSDRDSTLRTTICGRCRRG